MKVSYRFLRIYVTLWCHKYTVHQPHPKQSLPRSTIQEEYNSLAVVGHSENSQ